MGYNAKLLQALHALRQQIKEEEKTESGKSKVVCTDAALLQIAQLCPKKKTDLESIPGVGKVFIDNYAERFLAVVRKYEEVSAEKTVEINSEVGGILKELEKKLVNINKRNRLLYMPKASNKYAVDLFGAKANPLDILFGKGKAFTVCDLKGNTDEIKSDDAVKYRKYVQVLREANKDLRDKGQNDLYIGYPFVIGRLPGADFDVRAPLALFPVAAEKTPTKITLALDETRDVLCNNTLVLANYKFNGINKPLPDNDLDEASRAGFMEELIGFYKENEIDIIDCVGDGSGETGNAVEVVKLQEYKSDSFPRFSSGELQIEHCAVLGKFPVCDNAIQKDFDNIIKESKINTLLNDLLSEQKDYNEETVSLGGVPKVDGRQLIVSEQDLANINSLNSSQEAVISAIDFMDELVVQGPPGTGKSQVITSLISDAVSQNKTVLMVSEKKTALDVVYSRLGMLSQYALLIDDVGNKDAFYSQLHHMTSLGQFSGGSEESIVELSNKIDVLVGKLDVIAQKMYTPNEFGIEPYKLYQKSCRIDLNDQVNRKMIIAANNQIKDGLANQDFKAVNGNYELFKDENTCNMIEDYAALSREYQWLDKTKDGLSEFDIIELSEKLAELKNTVSEYNSKGFFGRLFGKGAVTNQINAVVSEYFTESDSQIKQLFFKEIHKVIKGIESYNVFRSSKVLYDGLAESEKEYINALLYVKEKCGCSFEDANFSLYNRLLTIQIDRFETKNRDLFQSIDNFNSIIVQMSDAMSQKQRLTRQQLEAILMGEMYNLNTSKRHGEILRIIESKRKWSVNKFINKFNFELFKSVKIWLLTPEVVSEIIPMQTGVFDLVIFDEASQMFVEKGIPSILRAKKVVIAGDSKQLRPSNLGAGRVEFDDSLLGEDEEVAAALEEESLLDLARFKYNDVMLNFHYRSRYEELIAFSNYAFYNGRLYVSPNTQKPEKPPIEVHKIEGGLWVDKSNLQEAKYIVEMLKRFFDERRAEETIGIITFNITQRDLIEDLIDEECAVNPEFASKIRAEIVRKQDGEDIGLFVKNIESVQGDERDVVIFSVGYARNEEGKVARRFGWLNQQGGENRLNVAISRAKKKVHIVTSINPSELQVDDIKNKGPKYLKKYLEYAFAISSRDEETAKQILLSLGDGMATSQISEFDDDFENQVYRALVECGYEVDTQVGIGGYRIDLAIKKDGNYVLGIECDGKLYQGSKSSRERDYHRQKYLESRGWRIHRIWSTNWWKNPKQEIEKICRIVDEREL